MGSAWVRRLLVLVPVPVREAMSHYFLGKDLVIIGSKGAMATTTVTMTATSTEECFKETVAPALVLALELAPVLNPL
jgi:hypothetical protein